MTINTIEDNAINLYAILQVHFSNHNTNTNAKLKELMDNVASCEIEGLESHVEKNALLEYIMQNSSVIMPEILSIYTFLDEKNIKLQLVNHEDIAHILKTKGNASEMTHWSEMLNKKNEAEKDKLYEEGVQSFMRNDHKTTEFIRPSDYTNARIQLIKLQAMGDREYIQKVVSGNLKKIQVNWEKGLPAKEKQRMQDRNQRLRFIMEQAKTTAVVLKSIGDELKALTSITANSATVGSSAIMTGAGEAVSGIFNMAANANIKAKIDAFNKAQFDYEQLVLEEEKIISLNSVLQTLMGLHAEIHKEISTVDNIKEQMTQFLQSCILNLQVNDQAICKAAIINPDSHLAEIFEKTGVTPEQASQFKIIPRKFMEEWKKFEVLQLKNGSDQWLKNIEELKKTYDLHSGDLEEILDRITEVRNELSADLKIRYSETYKVLKPSFEESNLSYQTSGGLVEWIDTLPDIDDAKKDMLIARAKNTIDKINKIEHVSDSLRATYIMWKMAKMMFDGYCSKQDIKNLGEKIGAINEAVTEMGVEPETHLQKKMGYQNVAIKQQEWLNKVNQNTTNAGLSINLKTAGMMFNAYNMLSKKAKTANTQSHLLREQSSTITKATLGYACSEEMLSFLRKTNIDAFTLGAQTASNHILGDLSHRGNLGTQIVDGLKVANKADLKKAQEKRNKCKRPHVYPGHISKEIVEKVLLNSLKSEEPDKSDVPVREKTQGGAHRPT